jgi:2-polyprenyl-3-methyl-5-hydroxy-6-metoxy-1,4-benzoquinol methylase
MTNLQMQLNDIESFYDDYGAAYGKGRVEEGLLFNDFIERPALRSLIQDIEYQRKKPVARILDVGCGPGIYTKDLAGSGKIVTALDISIKMLKLAQKLCKNHLNPKNYESTKFIHSSFENYNEENAEFDLILATFMLSYFSDLDLFFKKSRYLLDGQGKLITSMLHPIRMFSNGITNSSGYEVKDYFNNGYYGSDFMDKDRIIHLKRWTIEDVTSAAFNNGLLIERILEPRLCTQLPRSLNTNKSKFFESNPSIIMFMMRRK